MPLSDGLDTRPCKILDPRLLSVTSRYSIQGSELVFGIGNESVPRIIINDAVNLFFKPVSIFLISNHNSFRVLFDKIASVYFISKKCIYILASEIAIAQVTSTVPIVSTYCRSLLRLSSTYPILGWLGSRVVSVLDSGSEGPGFKSQPRRCRVTVLGKLFTPIVPLFTKQQNW